MGDEEGERGGGKRIRDMGREGEGKGRERWRGVGDEEGREEDAEGGNGREGKGRGKREGKGRVRC